MCNKDNQKVIPIVIVYTYTEIKKMESRKQIIENLMATVEQAIMDIEEKYPIRKREEFEIIIEKVYNDLDKTFQYLSDELNKD